MIKNVDVQKIYVKRGILFKCLLLLILMLFIFIENVYATGENLVKNPSFEEVKIDKPVSWDTYIAVKGIENGEIKVEKGEAHSGEYCAVIINHSENDCRFLQAISVQENKKYKLSCWIKTENIGAKGKGANISIGNQLVTSKDIKGINGHWEYVEMYLTTGRNISSINLTAGLGGYCSCNTGKAYIDDVMMEEVEAIPVGAAMTVMSGPGNVSNRQTVDRQSSSGKSSSNWLLWVIIAVACIVGLSSVLLKKENKKGSKVSKE